MIAQSSYGPVTWQTTPFDYPAVTQLPPQAAYARVVRDVGASLVRDRADLRLIEELTSLGTKGSDIRHEFDAPMTDLFLIDPSSRPANFDTDGDGMADAWERTYGLNPTDASDRNGDFDGTGYTNLEKHLNSFYDGTYPLSPLPSPWQGADVGTTGVAGTDGYSSVTFRNNGGGTDIYGTADKFGFIYQTLSGDATIIARVKALQATHPSAKAGVMMRA